MNLHTRRRFSSLLLGMACALTAPAGGQVDGGDQLLRRAYQSEATGTQREYFVYLPEGYLESGVRWPVILFLHGAGERGDGLGDLDYVLVHGPLMEAWLQRRPLPFIMVAPQLPMFGMEEQVGQRAAAEKPQRLNGVTPPRRAPVRSELPIVRDDADAFFPGIHQRYDPYPRPGEPPNGWFRLEKDLLQIMDSVLQEFRADPDRVYLTGLSYGGFGCFHMAARHPDRWAAVAPIVGTGRLEDAPILAQARLPIWMFGGGKDTVVKPHWLYAMARALEEAGHPSVRFTVHEDMSHDAWKRVYAGQDLYDWFLAHARTER